MPETPPTTFFTSEAIDRIVKAGGGLAGPSKWDERSTEDRRQEFAKALDAIASEFVSSKVDEIRAKAKGGVAPRGRGRPRDLAFELFVEHLQGVWLGEADGRFKVSRIFNMDTGATDAGGPLVRFLQGCCDELAECLKTGPEIFDQAHREAVRSKLQGVSGEALVQRVRRGSWRDVIRRFMAREKKRRP